MTPKKLTPAQQLAHKRQLKAEQMARYRAARKTTHLTSDELELAVTALTKHADSYRDTAARRGRSDADRAACLDIEARLRGLVAKLTGAA